MHSMRRIKCLIYHRSSFNHPHRRLLNRLFSLKFKLLLLPLALHRRHLPPPYVMLTITYA